MNTTDIRELAPKAVWQYFYELTQIPRPSGMKEPVGKYLEDFGKSLGLETLRDDIGNVLIRKPATPGKEHCKGVILQAHMDMVPQKNTGVVHDFNHDPIQTYVEEGWVKARNTTLGADNGIGVAAAMAVMASKIIEHPAIEMLITVDEETGMHGAFGLKPDFLKGEVLMNLDSEEEGELYVGCAGGLDVNVQFQYHEELVPEGDVALKISLTGLKGGHSGVDIHLQRANANKLMFRLLKTAVAEYEVRLASINGGSLRNAIPREAFAVVTVPAEGVDEFMLFISECETIFQDEFEGIESQITLKADIVDLPSGLMPEFVQDDLINSVCACFDGVFRYMNDMPEVVETSSNLAIVKSNGAHIHVHCLVRSSVDSRKEELASSIASVFSLAGAKVDLDGGYPGWKPRLNSPILSLMSQVYKNQYGCDPKVKIIHAGLECGIIGSHYPQLDMISFGPTICYPHSPNEMVNVESVRKFWDYLVEVLKVI